MNTSGRWWVPTGSQLGPDTADLEMLAVTGDNPRLDLGGVLLAVHRVGAAACAAVASKPLPSATDLVDHLNRARSALGGPAVDAVSKCVHAGSCDTGSYAGLFVRDVLDDADEAAVGLFTAAVGRGVAPPVAAHRAGSIYGVGKADIGRYRLLALDPKANPAALTAAADKALMTYVEKVVNEETSEPVSKAAAVMTAPKSELATAADGRDYYDVRDDDGRFAVGTMADPGFLTRMRVRYGIGGETAPKVSDGLPSTVASADTKINRAARVKTLQRQKQLKRQRLKRLVAVTAPEAAPVTRTSTSRRAGTRSATQRRTAQRISITPKAQIARETKAAKPKTTVVDADHEFLELMNPDLGHRVTGITGLGTEMSIPLDEATANEFIARAKGSPDGMIRIRHLLKQFGAEHYDTDEDTYGFSGPLSAYRERLNSLSLSAYSQDDPADPSPYELVEWKEIPNTSQSNYANSREVLDKRTEFAMKHLVGEDAVAFHPSEDGSGMVFYSIAHGFPAMVFEFVLDNPMGRIDYEPGDETPWHHEAGQLDLDQIYRVPNVTDEDLTERYYDQYTGVLRKRLHLVTVDEDEAQETISHLRKHKRVVKAVSVLERPAETFTPDDVSTPYWDARAASGRFAAAAEAATDVSTWTKTLVPASALTPAVSTKLSPERRAQRLRRLALLRRKQRMRTPAPAPIQTKTQSAARMQQRLATSRRAGTRSSRQLRSSVHTSETSTFEPDIQNEYLVMDSGSFQSKKEIYAGLDFVKGGIGATLAITQKSDLTDLDESRVEGDSLLESLRAFHYGVHIDSDELPEDEGKLYPGAAMTTRMNNILSAPDVAMVTATRIPHDQEGAGKVQLYSYWNPEPVVVIEFGESARYIDPDGPVTLVKTGQSTYIAHAEGEGWAKAGEADEVAYRIPIEHWLAVKPEDAAYEVDRVQGRL